MWNKGLNILIYLYIILIPFLPSKFRVGFIPFNGDALLALIILMYIIMIILNKETKKKFINGVKDFFHNYFSVFALAVLLMMFISITYSQYKINAFTESVRFLTYIVLYFIIKYEANDKIVINNIIKYFILTIILLCFIGFFQKITRIGVNEFIYYVSYGTKVRIPSTVGNPNSFGGLLILAIFPVVMLTLSEKRKKIKMIYLICSLLIFINIIFTESRNAWLGLFIGAIALALIYNIKLIFGFFTVGCATLFIPQVFNRVKEFTDMSQNIGRIQLWKLALIIIKEHPFRGIGNGNYQKLYTYYTSKYPDLNYNHHTEFTVHNNYLKIQSELGIIGIISFLGMVITVIKRINKLINQKIHIKYKSFFIGFLASFIAFAFMNLSDDFFMVPKIASYFWILFAAGEAIQYKIEEY
jgi:O-antigen ligase